MDKKLLRRKKMYEKPIIYPTTIENTSPYEGAKYGDVLETTIDAVSFKDILKEYGSPVFVISEKKLREKYRKFLNTFKAEYQPVVVGYSYKTNYLSAICAILHQEGAWAEVVSGMEYEMAMQLGVYSNQIIFNGCYKKRDELERAVLGGSLINVDSKDEAILLEKIALKHKKRIKVGLRVSMNLTAQPWTKFGLNLESGQAYELCKRLYNSGLLEVCGLHAHISTYVYDPTLYWYAAKGLTQFASRIEDEFGYKIEYFDLGGGFPSANTLQQQFLPASYLVPPLESYAKAVCVPIQEYKSKSGIKPILFLEPGRAIVDEVVTCLSTVVATKMVASQTQGIIIDAGINILPNCNWYDHDIIPVSRTGMARMDTVIFGPLCMQIDVIRKYIKLPPLHAGDVLMIRNTGSYNMTQSTQFIYSRPPIVLINDGKIEVVKKAESVDDIKRLEEVPERFLLNRKLKAA